jgi:hypothetical protein
MSEAEQDAMEVAEELRKALAVKNREGAEKDAEIARLKNAARSWTVCSVNASGITTTTIPRFRRLGWSKLARP